MKKSTHLISFWINKKNSVPIASSTIMVVDYLFNIWLWVEYIPRCEMSSGCLNAENVLQLVIVSYGTRNF